MNIEFHKMQALGNDFVIIDEQSITSNGVNCEYFLKNISLIADRKYGIGCDLIALYSNYNKDNQTVDVKFFNQDGTYAEMCGNATRCITYLINKLYNVDTVKIISNGKIYDSHIIHPNTMQISKIVETSNMGNNTFVSVNMNVPSFDADVIGLTQLCNIFNVNEKYLGLSEDESKFLASQYIVAVNVGNPHLVIGVDKKLDFQKEQTALTSIAKKLENSRLFRNKTNVSFVKNISDDYLAIKVFERGVGWTLACGTAAFAAVAVNDHLLSHNLHTTIVRQEGGEIIFKQNADKTYNQIGSCSYVFFGNIVL